MLVAHSGRQISLRALCRLKPNMSVSSSSCRRRRCTPSLRVSPRAFPVRAPSRFIHFLAAMRLERVEIESVGERRLLCFGSRHASLTPCCASVPRGRPCGLVHHPADGLGRRVCHAVLRAATLVCEFGQSGCILAFTVARVWCLQGDLENEDPVVSEWGTHVCTLFEGDSFGSLSLLEGVPRCVASCAVPCVLTSPCIHHRTFTLVALQDLELATLHREDYAVSLSCSCSSGCVLRLRLHSSCILPHTAHSGPHRRPRPRVAQARGPSVGVHSRPRLQRNRAGAGQPADSRAGLGGRQQQR